jgi:hypothetical protein
MQKRADAEEEAWILWIRERGLTHKKGTDAEEEGWCRRREPNSMK